MFFETSCVKQWTGAKVWIWCDVAKNVCDEVGGRVDVTVDRDVLNDVWKNKFMFFVTSQKT